MFFGHFAPRMSEEREPSLNNLLSSFSIAQFRSRFSPHLRCVFLSGVEYEKENTLGYLLTEKR